MIHEWHFGNTSRDKDLYITAVCRQCGLIRRAIAADGKRVDLRGECPGEAQEPEESVPQVF